VVFASGKDRRTDTTRLHTNFKIAREAGGYLALGDSAGVTVSVLLIHHFDRRRPSPDIESFAHVQLFEPDAARVTVLTHPPTLTSRVGIATRGSSTEGNSKASLMLEFEDEVGFNRVLGPLSLPAGPDWVLDGTDPRRTGGSTGDEIAPGALRYSGPIEISRDVRIVVRARNPQYTALTGPDNPPLRSIWSGPVTETFVIASSPWGLVPRLVDGVLDGSGKALFRVVPTPTPTFFRVDGSP